MTHRVVVGGECLVDVITESSGAVREVPGGGPFNTARAIARLGGSVSFLGCISRDRLGERLRDELVADGVDLSIAVRTDLPTTIAHATLDPSGAAAYRFEDRGHGGPGARTHRCAGGARYPAGRRPRRHPRPRVRAIRLEASRVSWQRCPPDTLVMLDPNARPSAIDDLPTWRARIQRLSTRADVIRVSVDDLEVLDDTAGPLDVARALADDGALVLLTDGGRPARLVSRAFPTVRLPLPESAIVDTVGAGDSFGGAFLAWWLDQGHDRAALRDAPTATAAARVALTAAAMTCSRVGADPPTREELGEVW